MRSGLFKGVPVNTVVLEESPGLTLIGTTVEGGATCEGARGARASTAGRARPAAAARGTAGAGGTAAAATAPALGDALMDTARNPRTPVASPSCLRLQRYT